MTVIPAPAETPPFILTNPQFAIGADAASLTDLKCSLNQISCGVDQDSNDYDTFCGSYRAYGVARYTITLTVFQSFDVGGPWATLWPLRGTIAHFSLLPDAAKPVGADNPLMSGTVRVPPMVFIDAAVNEASSIDIELAVQGEPDFDVTPGALGAAAASAGTQSQSGSTSPTSAA